MYGGGTGGEPSLEGHGAVSGSPDTRCRPWTHMWSDLRVGACSTMRSPAMVSISKHNAAASCTARRLRGSTSAPCVKACSADASTSGVMRSMSLSREERLGTVALSFEAAMLLK
jgi:hypothetical protein